ncbi:MFS transporter [Microbacterium marinilacus]|uniref:Major facilitator superfamily (MFS) profile domain-containing protein n=1 Tax=Microbacterium marinilacus TaxID=415209 RepID=A0ABP7B5K2_9MICO|nr:MFS transporter [Microbacterium marinilacus]MBY0689929.1 MFS transporter [Microbacterium marinilacus]
MTALAPPAPSTEERSPAKTPSAIVAVLALAGIIAAGTQPLIVPLIGRLPALLGAAADDTAWAVTATLLASAAAVPIAGRVGDMLGKRRVLLASLIPLIAGSVLCALATSLGPMIAGRALQGLGMGVVPLGISLLREVVPAERIGSAVATMSASMGIGGAVALPFAAAIAEYASWRIMFAAFAALSAVVFVLVLWLVPAGSGRVRGARFDLPGALLLSGALAALLLPVSKGAAWGWSSPLTLGLFAAAVFLLGYWVLQQLQAPQPLVNLRSLHDPQVSLTNLASLLVGFAMYGQSLILPQILQLPAETGYGLGQSMLQMALWLAPGGVVMMFVSPFGARLTAARGPRTTLALGALAIALGYGASLLLLGSTWGVMGAIVVINVGVGLAYGAIPMLIMSAVPGNETASATSFNTLIRSVGSSSASAVSGVILAALTTTSAGATVPSLQGFQLALAAGGLVALLAVGVILCLPRARRRSSHRR